jgi:hypothetical protein
MDAQIPDRWGPALQAAFWGAAPFVFFLASVVEGFIAGNYRVAAICAVLFFLSIGAVVHWDQLVPHWLREKVGALEYLSDKDSELSSAIREMVWYSAWAKWYAAQLLVNSGRPTTEDHTLLIATSLVAQNLIDGDIEARGRLPGEMDYKLIPRTYWRSTVPHFIVDPQSLWRMILIPKGGAEIARNGTITARNAAAEGRTAVLRNYDSLLVDAFQFEKVWPKRKWNTDKQRRRLLRQALKRGLDKDEILRLLGGRAKWQLQLLRFGLAGIVGL